MAEVSLGAGRKAGEMCYFIEDLEDGVPPATAEDSAQAAWAEYYRDMDGLQVILENGYYVAGLGGDETPYEEEYDRLAAEVWERLQKVLRV